MAGSGPMRDLSVRLTTEPCRARVQLAGELDVASRHLLAPLVDQVLSLHPSHVLVDLRQLWFCDVAGARELANAHCRWSGDGLGVVLHGAGPAIRQVFDLSGYAHLLG